MKKCTMTMALGWLVLASVPTMAQDLRISIENLASVDGFFLTPMWVGFHDGSFDLFDPGVPVSAGLEQLAEAGDPTILATEFAMPGRIQLSEIGNLAGFGGAPIIDPGEIAMKPLTPVNPASYPYMSFASMVIPSNDAFIGNADPLAIRVFNNDGTFAGPITVDIFGSDIWDAGTEVNDTMGAAFSFVGGVASDEGSSAHAHPGLANFEGTETPAGMVAVGSAPGANTPVARITITQVPEPSAWAMAFSCTTCLLAAARRSRSM